MRTAALEDVVECLDRRRVPVKESDRAPGDVPYYGANGQQGWIDRAIFDEPLVIVAEDGGHFDEPARGVAFRISGPSWVNNHGHVLRATDRVDHDYLYHALRNYDFAPYISGSTRSKLNQKQLLRAEIPLPPLAEQRRIAAILEQADDLRAKRRQILTHLDDITQAIFYEMFGDPARNSRSWEIRRLGDLALAFRDGPFGSNLKSSHYVASGVRVIRLQNIGVGHFVDVDRAYVTADHFASLPKHRCLPGDVLIGTLGDPNLRACIHPSRIGEALNKADCVQMRVNPAVAHPTWACWLLNMPGTLTLVNGMLHGQTRSRVAMGQLRELNIPVPPIRLQQEFATRVENVDSQRTLVHCLARSDDELFVSLQSRAFLGEL